MKTFAVFLAMVLMVAAISTARAEVKTEVVEYRHGDVVLEGYLAYDDSIQGKRPGSWLCTSGSAKLPTNGNGRNNWRSWGTLPSPSTCTGKGSGPRTGKRSGDAGGKIRGGPEVDAGPRRGGA